jgi:hypothetical protein
LFRWRAPVQLLKYATRTVWLKMLISRGFYSVDPRAGKRFCQKENADFTGIPARAQVGRTLHAPTAVQAHE